MSFGVHSTNGQSLKLIALNVIRNSKRRTKFIKRRFFSPPKQEMSIFLSFRGVANNALINRERKKYSLKLISILLLTSKRFQ